MKTNYNQLNTFETMVVIMVFVGLVITGVELFLSLPKIDQEHITNATSFFDLHNEALTEWENVKFAANLMPTFDNQFYIAFTQVMAIQTEDLNNSLLAYKNIFAFTVDKLLPRRSLLAVEQGRVLGASVSNNCLSLEQNLTENFPQPNFPYSYSEPDVKNIKFLLWNLISN